MLRNENEKGMSKRIQGAKTIKNWNITGKVIETIEGTERKKLRNKKIKRSSKTKSKEAKNTVCGLE